MNSVDVVRRPGETRLIFEPVLDIAGARHLYQTLDGARAGAEQLVLDANRVERVDAAALQVLAAFCRTIRAAGVAVRWHASPVLRDAAAQLDLAESLGQLE